MSHCQRACTRAPCLFAMQQGSQCSCDRTESHVQPLHTSYAIVSWHEGWAHEPIIIILELQSALGPATLYASAQPPPTSPQTDMCMLPVHLT